MILVFGLGNPGNQYALSRHNLGFLAIDYLVRLYQCPPMSYEHNCLRTMAHVCDLDLLLIKPQTYMNHSGKAVLSFCKTHKILPKQVIAIHDDIDLSFGKVRVKSKGGTAGHHGIDSIHEALETGEFYRIRFGIGRPLDAKIEISDYVLSPFNSEEQKNLPNLYPDIQQALEKILAGLKTP